MTAVVLRRAATLIRERAQAVPGSPWDAFEVRGVGGLHAEWMVDSERRMIAGNIGISEDPWAEPIAAHIASWHPVVALAVADWLDSVARDADERARRASKWVGVEVSANDEGFHISHNALAVARVYLAESA